MLKRNVIQWHRTIRTAPVFLPMKCKERRCRAWLVRSSAVVFIPLKGPVHPAARHGGRSDCSTQVTDWQDAAVHRLRMALCKHPTYCSIKAPRVLQNKATRGRQCSSFANTTDVLQCQYMQDVNKEFPRFFDLPCGHGRGICLIRWGGGDFVFFSSEMRRIFSLCMKSIIISFPADVKHNKNFWT